MQYKVIPAHRIILLKAKDLPNDQTKVLSSFPKQKAPPAHTDEITINMTV